MEYIKKHEAKEHRLFFRNMIDATRSKIKEKGITFTYKLVGSAKRNLILNDNNKGFDCDYQITLQKNKQEFKDKDIKKIFMDEFDVYLKNSRFSSCEDSSLAITIKNKDIAGSKIISAYDVVIIRENNGSTEILKNEKNKNGNGPYHFIPLPDMKNNKENFKLIKGFDMWSDLRELYKDEKIKNEKRQKKDKKKSFQILNQVVNEILDKFS